MYVSKTLPAELEGLVCPQKFQTFCEQLDGSLQLMVEERERVSKRRMYLSIVLGLVIGIPLGRVLLWVVSSNEFSFIHILVLSFFLGVIVGIINVLTRVLFGACSGKDHLQKMRNECEVMTISTPGVSFHVVLVQFSVFIADDVDHIAVTVHSAGRNTLGTASLAVHPAANNHKAVSDQYALCSDNENVHGITIV